MPIDSKHPDFIKHEPIWKKCADFNDGGEAVKGEGKLYLPIPEGMNLQEYAAFLQRATFFNGVGRTVTGLVGAMTRVDAQVRVPPLIEHLIEDATGNGKSLQEVIKQVLSRDMITGRVGILIDKPEEARGATRFVTYNEHAIINWRRRDGKLVMVVLEEYVLAIDQDDPYEAKFVPQYRELWLNNDGVYQARVWKQKRTVSSTTTVSPGYEPGPTLTPETSTGPLTEIPFVFCSPVGTESKVVKAPLLDLCNINVGHYLNSADLEHGRHLVTLPTPWVTGVDPDDYKKGLKIGSGTAWLIDNDNAKVGMLEFTGAGLGHLAEAISEKQHQMAVLGAKLLQPQRKQVESAELARMANAGDESILVGIAKAVGVGFLKALQMAAIWEGANPDRVFLQMNTDFIDTKLAPDEMLALYELYLGGAIGEEEFLNQLKVGERLMGEVAEAVTLAKAEKAVRQAQVERQAALSVPAVPTTGGTGDAGRGRETRAT